MLPETIRITNSPAADLQQFLAQKKYSSIHLLTDENTRKHCYPLLEAQLPPHHVIVIKSGEQHKTIETCTTVWEALTNSQADRHAVLIVLGGGVLGDLGGFCAATYKRGIDFILLPTTLLAQVDASIGGKLGIDFNHFKNHIGLFKQPTLNLLFSGFLNTLPEVEMRSGFAEVIKHTVISDRKMWEIIRRKSLTEQDWPTIIRHSAAFKYSVIKEDPYEKNLRKILNAGHTIGHAIESHLLSVNRSITHGEAVAAGLICEFKIAVEKKCLSEEEFEEVKTYILKLFGKISLEESDIKEITSLCIQDKKNKGNRILCVLPNGIGKAQWDVEITLDQIESSLSFYRLLQT